MHLDLTHLGRHGRGAQHVDRTYDAGVFATADADDDGYRVAAPVGLVIDVDREGADTFRVTGRVVTRLELECSRCLEPFQIPVDAEFELRYVPQARNTGDAEREIAQDDLTTAYYENNILDLGALMREQFQLALPMKPLCADDCKGLCAQCGRNLNRGACDCAPQWEDSRLGVLKGLLDAGKRTPKG
jgi:uncharacterized protein